MIRTNTTKPKLIVIVGQTSSGKTELSIKLAKKFPGEIVSADSRQVYKGMDVGTGKATKREMQGIPHHLLDIIFPKRKFTVAQYQKLALKAIEKIHAKEKLPFLVGGTGFYIQAVVDNLVIPEVRPDWKLRAKLARKTAQELFQLLQKQDPQRARTIQKTNKRRLIRALEIVFKTQKPVPPLKKRSSQFELCILGIKKSKKEIEKLIQTRLQKRLPGILKEIKKLHLAGISWKRLEEFGLEYRYGALYLQKKITREHMREKLQSEIVRFAKRQMTWFKRDKRICWITDYQAAEKLVEEFVCRPPK